MKEVNFFSLYGKALTNNFKDLLRATSHTEKRKQKNIDEF